MFLLGGIYFALLAAFNETTIYATIPASLCFIAFGLGFKADWLFSSPWRVATAVLVIALTSVQEAANLSVESAGDIYTVSSTLINGIMLVLFLGVLLQTLKNVVGRGREEGEASSVQKQVTSSKS